MNVYNCDGSIIAVPAYYLVLREADRVLYIRSDTERLLVLNVDCVLVHWWYSLQLQELCAVCKSS